MNLQEQERDRAAEQWLDEAIGHLRDAGPRAGLETRVLAGLRAHAERRRRRWHWVLAGCAAAMLLVALLASRPRSRQSTPDIVQQNPPTQTQAAPLPAVASVKQPPKRSPHVGEVREVSVAGAGRSLILTPAREAREATFPSGAAPLNEQGKLLQAYLRQTPPQQLALIAARQPSTSSLESEDLNIAPLQIADLTPKTESTKDQDQN
jgi:hypothetical protein